MGITTYNPTTLEVTNRWVYNDVISLVMLRPSTSEFQLTMKKENGKIDNMKFSTDYRIDLMTEALRFRHFFAEKPKEILVHI